MHFWRLATLLLPICIDGSFAWSSSNEVPAKQTLKSFFKAPFTATTNLFSSQPTASEDYQWPENLYIELRDMAAVSFLVYAFAYVTDAARESGLEGLEVSENGQVSLAKKSDSRCFSATEILDIVQENREILREKFEFAFGDNLQYELLVQNLRTLQGMWVLFSLLSQ